MIIKKVETKDDLEKGDIILIDDGAEVFSEVVHTVKVSEHDGVEVIFNIKKNKYFNLGMHLKGKSWVKELNVVRSGT